MSDNAESPYFNLNFGNGIHDAVIRSGILDDDEWDGTDDGPLDKYTYPRMDVAEIMNRLIHNGTWQKKFHMSPEAFDYLCDVLREEVGVDERRSRCGSGGNDPVTPEMSVMMGLRFMGGEFKKSIEDFAGVSPDTCKRHCEKICMRLMVAMIPFSLSIAFQKQRKNA